jgi:hypothetical protein
MINILRIVKFSNAIVPVVFFFIIVPVATLVFAHGPKGHKGGDFTFLQAAKKGMVLYDRLITSGKLKENWETDLVSIEVIKKNSGAQKEFVVKFSRAVSEPRSVFIFLSDKGEYKGSNFTGK